MSLRRRSGSSPSFSMASMTDVIFLLLIFFMITSTFVVPNIIKVNLPASDKQASASKEVLRLTLTPDLHYFLAYGQHQEEEILFEDIPAKLAEYQAVDPDVYMAIYADESVPYKEVIKVVTLASRANVRIMLATKVADI
ncbi:biopolymer transporter ExbD [Porphyromonas crevioricanis]|uniref:Biopolymer transporter ExbD n=2 Tax=Porphyromonas crevioricanis TaxID=393921 RepID=A0A0A2FIK6_9PORP|nr:biopolymer transporter ExbD [Porphyromonas crevioricanis]KGN89957.1 biopolymer transporter ExbD [Porphyromonas crevioricanis]KGN94139.1 biopolymer transporter ExbD [Porphyromonas crevioricanis]SJZ66976.1 biopolymer transport protein ExbD [Porphyromonas crevioricanis]SQH73951.1 colicin uptake protein TolR [Porphyromonas crevioricanis]GAD04661.1 biopolymer transport protein ExbD/TolR [Porphyromonas crevioricanis JCM 15906]